MRVISKYPILVDPSQSQKDAFRLKESNRQLPGAVQKTEVAGLTINGTTPVFIGNDELTRNDYQYLKPIISRGKTLTPMDEWLYSEKDLSEGRISFGEFQNYGDVFENTANDRFFNAEGGITNVITKNPILIDPTYSNAVGDVVSSQGQEVGVKSQDNVTFSTTEKPTSTSTQSTYFDYLEKQAKEKGTKPNTQAQLDAAKTQGKFWDNASKSWKKFKDSPAGQFALQQTLAYLQQKVAGGQTNVTVPPPPPDATEKDNTIWYIVGGVAIIGILAFVLVKGNKPA